MKLRHLKRSAASISPRLRRILTLALCLMIVLSIALPLGAFAQKAEGLEGAEKPDYVIEKAEDILELV